MIIFADYRKPGTQKTIWGYYTGSGKGESLDPDDIPIKIKDLIEDTKIGLDIYISNFSMYLGDIISTLYTVGYNPVMGNPTIKEMHEKQYKYLISGEGEVYHMTVKRHKRACRLINSDNILSLNSRQDIISTWGDPDGEQPEIEYAKSIYRCISSLNEECGIKKNAPITISGYARREWRRQIGYWNMNDDFPDACNTLVSTVDTKTKKEKNVTLEEWVRKSYHGGLNISRGKAKTQEKIGAGLVLDVNSLYPYVMYNFPMPKGTPHYNTGKPTEKEIRDARAGYIYIFFRVRIKAKLKEDGIPCLRIPGRDPQRFTHQRDWLESTQYYDYHNSKFVPWSERNDHLIELTLTQTDYTLMYENYDIEKIEYLDYIWFSTSTNFFKSYVRKFYIKKSEAKEPGKKRVAKMMLNSLSGNMAKLPEHENLLIKIDKHGNVDLEPYKTGGGSSYIYIGSAITSYARRYIISKAKPYGDRWIYTDTDSIHLIGGEILDSTPVSGKCGDFKIEKRFDQAIYYKPKMYGMIKDGVCSLTLAGIPQDSTHFIESCIDHKYRKDLDISDPYIRNLSDKEAAQMEKLFSTGEIEKMESTGENIIDFITARQERFQKDCDEKGLRALVYSRYPTTTRMHGEDMFTENLKLNYGSICFT